MRCTFNVLFFLKKNATKKDGTAPIVARITINGKSCQFNTKQFTIPKSWNVGLNRVGGRSAEAKKINLVLEDIKNLKKENITIGFDRRPWIMTKRQKTDTQTVVPILKIAQIILDKYDGLTDGVLLPVPTNQKTNAYLKEIADMCGIKKNLTFHLARHTFATTITLSNGVPIETVSKMLGHTNIKTTQIYARVTNGKVSKDMQLLSKKLKGELS